jgi:hypothetical protein
VTSSWFFLSTLIINPLALELDIYSLAHHLCKMLIFYHLNQNTDVSVTPVEVLMDDSRSQSEKIGTYFRDIAPMKRDKLI